MIYFPDTSLIFKLAGFDLLKEAFAPLGVPPDPVFILKETKQMCQGNKMRTKYGRTTLAIIETFIRQTSVIPITLDPVELEILTDTDGIDGGELILFAATKDYNDFFIVTDDKNSLRALAKEQACSSIFVRLTGKVICLEQLLLWIIERHSYAVVRPKLLRSPHEVRALEQTLGLNRQSPQNQVEAALLAAVDQLRLETNYILVRPSFS